MTKKLICLIVVLAMAMSMSGCLATIGATAFTAKSEVKRFERDVYDYVDDYADDFEDYANDYADDFEDYVDDYVDNYDDYIEDYSDYFYY